MAAIKYEMLGVARVSFIVPVCHNLKEYVVFQNNNNKNKINNNKNEIEKQNKNVIEKNKTKMKLE